MLRLLGIPVSDDDARSLVATLLVEGTPDALTAAAQLTKGVERDLHAVGLTRAERTAVLACLEDPPDGLAELRGALMRDHRDHSLNRSYSRTGAAEDAHGANPPGTRGTPARPLSCRQVRADRKRSGSAR